MGARTIPPVCTVRAAGPGRHGFTLVELVVVLTIMAIVLMIAMPQYRLIVEHERLRDAAQTAQSDFMFARAEAIRRNTDVYVVFRTDGDRDWCYGLSQLSSCDCRITDVANASACALASPDGTRTLKVVTSQDYRDIRLIAVAFGGSLGYIGFSPYRGTTTQGAGTPVSGSVEFQSPDNAAVRVLVNLVGRASPCSNQLSGYRPCP